MKTWTFKWGEVLVEVTIQRGQRKKIVGRSFRGENVVRAGNFFVWNNIDEFFEDPDFEDMVLPALVAASRKNERTFTVEIKLPGIVGWTTVMRKDEIWDDDIECEEGELSNGVVADFVTNLEAPEEKRITVIGQGRMEDSGTLLRIVLYNIRPGIAIPSFRPPRGRKGRRVPEELNLVFWHFEDPGEEPLSIRPDADEDDDWESYDGPFPGESGERW